MSTIWNSALSWLPRRNRDERALESIVVAVGASMSRRRAMSVDALRAEAEKVALIGDEQEAIAASLALFAAASQNTIGLMPFDVQLRAAAAMALGFATEMQTGEGKTLAVAAAATALALRNRRVHVATVNQYLAERDHGLFEPVLGALGLTAGLLTDRDSPDQKRSNYACSIVYGTGYAFGFDYLREQLRSLQQRSMKPGEKLRRRLSGVDDEHPLQPPLDCAIVDELDAVLLDEAGVPLILSEPRAVSCEAPDVFRRATQLAEALKAGGHCLLGAANRRFTVSEDGLRLIAMHFPRDLSAQLRRPWQQYIEDALTASVVFRRDVDYVVADDRIWIVDGSTGRIFDDRRWPEGLQRAVEFQESVSFSPPTTGAARITRQRFFKLYRHLTGASGTLVEAREELTSTYGSSVYVVPPRLPSQLVRLVDRCFRDTATRDRAVVDEAAHYRGRNRPVLVGCRSVETSKEMSRLFDAVGIPHEVLNGTQTAAEAKVVGEAGRAGNVLIATNLAGRGTDIRLDESARSAGGLHVIGVEYHDSPRVDRQLLGRAGRQGDPGSGRFFTSADDLQWRSRPELAARIRSLADTDGELRIDLVAKEIQACRVAVETEARLRRRQVSAYDAWLDDALETLGQAE